MTITGLKEHFGQYHHVFNTGKELAGEIEKVAELKGVSIREFLREAVSLYVEAFNQGWEDSKYKSRKKNL